MTALSMDDTMRRLQIQQEEFEGLVELWTKYQQLPAIVDDDYPAARHYFESSLQTFLEKLWLNRPEQMKLEARRHGCRVLLKHERGEPY